MSRTSKSVLQISYALVATLSAASLAGCQDRASGQRESPQPSTLRAQIDKLRADYEAAVATGDPNTLTPLLEQGAVMVRPGGPDWDAMAAAAGTAPFPPGARIAIKPIEVVALSDEWAYEFGTSVTTYTPAGADQPVELRDTYLVLFRNTGSGWKAYREVASSAPPPSGWPKD
jgi:outer membrane murein-binding lipoprotein Lpp